MDADTVPLWRDHQKEFSHLDGWNACSFDEHSLERFFFCAVTQKCSCIALDFSSQLEKKTLWGNWVGFGLTIEREIKQWSCFSGRFSSHFGKPLNYLSTLPCVVLICAGGHGTSVVFNFAFTYTATGCKRSSSRCFAVFIFGSTFAFMNNAQIHKWIRTFL